MHGIKVLSVLIQQAMVRRRKGTSGLGKVFDKYAYYREAVQSPERDVEFLDQAYKDLRNKPAQRLGEDFCGTFAISCEWIKAGAHRRAVGVDMDQEPLDYGQRVYGAELSKDEKSRLQLCRASVLDQDLPGGLDIVVAQNFSYFVLKERAQMRAYFASSLRRLKRDGIFVLDCFGGRDVMGAVEESTRHGNKFTYYWDQDFYDPINQEGKFWIHFRPFKGRKYEKVFEYDWRLWGMRELKDILLEVGFKRCLVYWEGTTPEGEGSGDFAACEATQEEVDSWVAYIVGLK